MLRTWSKYFFYILLAGCSAVKSEAFDKDDDSDHRQQTPRRIFVRERLSLPESAPQEIKSLAVRTSSNLSAILPDPYTQAELGCEIARAKYRQTVKHLRALRDQAIGEAASLSSPTSVKKAIEKAENDYQQAITLARAQHNQAIRPFGEALDELSPRG